MARSTVIGKMLHKHFIRRQLTGSNKQTAIFVLCVTLAVVTLAALSAFGESINNTLVRDAKALHAGDIIIESNFEFSEPLAKMVANLRQQGLVAQSPIYEFYSVVRVAGDDDTLLSNLKVVGPTYPLYGQVELVSGRPCKRSSHRAISLSNKTCSTGWGLRSAGSYGLARLR
jgi:putative ABC transport system permease protein